MIGTSTFDYVFIQACILGLHYVAPLCVLYCVCAVGLYGTQTLTLRLPRVLEAVAVAETLFYLCVFLPYRAHLQREAAHPPAPSREARQKLARLCLDNCPDPAAFLQKWFLGADLGDIRRENLKQFFLWAYFNRGGPFGDDEDELDGYVDDFEARLGRRLADGWGSAECLRLTLDPVPMLHRSLIWYGCIAVVDTLTHLKLWWQGFHFHRTDLGRFFAVFPPRPLTLLARHRSPATHTTYWYRPHTSTTTLPVVFIHGIGVGLYPYTKFFDELSAAPGMGTTGLLLIEIMCTSSRITEPCLGREDMCREIAQILDAHFGPEQKVVLVTHSYGSVVATHLLHDAVVSPRLGPLVLIDPVSVLLHLPDVAYNFTRRRPVTAPELQLHYFGSMDIGVAHTLARHFFWSQNVLWKKDLVGRRVTVSLGARDLIVDTEAVAAYLTGGESPEDERARVDGPGALTGAGDAGRKYPKGDGRRANGETEKAAGRWKDRAWTGDGIDVLWFPGLDHAQVFDKPGTRRRLVDAIRVYCLTG